MTFAALVAATVANLPEAPRRQLEQAIANADAATIEALLLRHAPMLAAPAGDPPPCGFGHCNLPGYCREQGACQAK